MAGGDSTAARRRGRPTGRAVEAPPSSTDPRQNLDLVGPRLRAARAARGLSLREMARRISVSPSFVSQVETGKASPSVGTLYSFVQELGMSLDELMEGDAGPREGRAPAIPALTTPPAALAVSWIHRPGSNASSQGNRVQTAAGRSIVKLKGVTWERLTSENDPHVEFLHVTYSPGSASCSDDDLMRHGGWEYGHVTSGRLRVQVGFDIFELGPGDSINFDSMTPHRLENPYTQPCLGIWVVVDRIDDHRLTAPE